MSKRLTWRRQNGEWGVEGIDLSTLPPRTYGCLYKLKKIEDEVERMNGAGSAADSPAMALVDLLEVLGVSKYAD